MNTPPPFPDRQTPPDRRRPDPLALRAADAQAAAKLKSAGLALFVIGGSLSAVGAISFYSHYAHILSNLNALGADAEGLTPEYVWCLYVGVPLTLIGSALRIAARMRTVGPLPPDRSVR